MSQLSVLCICCGAVIADEYNQVKLLYTEKAYQCLFTEKVNRKKLFAEINKERRKQNKAPLASCCQVALMTNVDQEEFLLPLSTEMQRTDVNKTTKIRPTDIHYHSPP